MYTTLSPSLQSSIFAIFIDYGSQLDKASAGKRLLERLNDNDFLSLRLHSFRSLKFSSIYVPARFAFSCLRRFSSFDDFDVRDRVSGKGNIVVSTFFQTHWFVQSRFLGKQ